VLSLRETASILGISCASLRRLIARGDGPRVTKLSVRRRGVRLQHALEWLDERVEPVTSEVHEASADRR
jgi:predicted DNA-binding transcriptional regulator AlpA